MQNYEMFYDVYTAEKRRTGAQMSKKGKGRDDEAWDPDMFGEWAASVFQVRGVGGGGGLGDEHEDGVGGDSRSRSRSLSRDGSM